MKSITETRIGVLRRWRSHIIVLRPAGESDGDPLDIQMALRLAASLRAPLWLIEPSQVQVALARSGARNSIAVRVLQGAEALRAEKLLAKAEAGGFGAAPLTAGTTEGNAAKSDLHPVQNGPERRALKKEAMKLEARAADSYVAPRYRRLWLEAAPSLAGSKSGELGQMLAAAEIARDGRVVLLVPTAADRDREIPSSVSEAVEWLAGAGFVVVRATTASNRATNGQTPVIDLPVADDLLMRLELAGRAAFILALDSDAALTVAGTRTPVLTLDVADPVGFFPRGSRDLFTHRNTTSTGGAGEVADSPAQNTLRAVQDMVATLSGPLPPETQAQLEYRLLAVRAGMERSTDSRVKPEFGPQHSFIGRGRLAPSAARGAVPAPSAVPPAANETAPFGRAENGSSPRKSRQET